MRIKDILRSKGGRLATISPNASLLDASRAITTEAVGLLIVRGERGETLGFLTERDLISYIAVHGATALGATVLMARSRVEPAVSPDDGVTDVMKLLTRERRRHAAVMRDGELVGIVSVGDLLKSRIVEKDQEADVLRDLARGALAHVG